MNKEEIEELKDFTIDLTDIDELALGLEVCSKKSNMVIQEFADIIIQLQQQCKKQKEVIDRIDKYIKPLNTNRDDEEYYDINWYNKDVLLSMLKEVSE